MPSSSTTLKSFIEGFGGSFPPAAAAAAEPPLTPTPPPSPETGGVPTPLARLLDVESLRRAASEDSRRFLELELEEPDADPERAPVAPLVCRSRGPAAAAAAVPLTVPAPPPS